MAQRRVLRLSMSHLKQCLRCLKSYWFEHVETENKKKILQKSDYPRLCGRKVHFFVASLYKKHGSDRKFYYKTLQSARKAWMYTWNKAQVEDKDKIVNPDRGFADKYGAIGFKCIENYWSANINRPDPLFIEKRFTMPWESGVELTGVFDQVRSLTIEAIEKIRPEVVENGVLSNLFDPVVVVDLKTGYGDYDIEVSDTDSDALRKQYELQHDLQASAYSLLYKKHFGKYPIGFLVYRLRDNKPFLVKGDLEPIQKTLREVMRHVISNIRNESYPKHIGRFCKGCDFIKECHEESTFTPIFSTEIPQSLDVERKEDHTKQLRLKLKYKKDKK